jgi:hypothetical protein
MPKFEKGRSGNPGGRPRRKDSGAALRKAISDAAPGVVEAMVKAALNGDTTAARILLDRSVPVLKPIDRAVPVPLGSDLAQASRVILDGLASGALTPDQGAALAGIVASLARTLELVEFEERLSALEAANVARQP